MNITTIDIESEYLKELEKTMANDIQEEIDFSIMADILKSTGWTEVIIEPFKSNVQAVDVLSWVEDNFKGRYHGRGSRWLFKEAKDATMFILRWGDAAGNANR